MAGAINLKEGFEDKFVAYLDVMGFSNLVFQDNIKNLESYFDEIIKVLDDLKKDKANIQSLIISDSIILVSPSGLKGLTDMLWAIQRIQSSILWRKVLLRGAVSFGQVFYDINKNIIVGKGYIRAYLLEQEAIYPRVIIDPSIIKLIANDKVGFLKRVNKTLEYNFEDRLIFSADGYKLIPDDAIFIDYANKTICKKEISRNLSKIYALILENLYSDQKLYTKYTWLRNYFWDILLQTANTLYKQNPTKTKHSNELGIWIDKFRRL